MDERVSADGSHCPRVSEVRQWPEDLSLHTSESLFDIKIVLFDPFKKVEQFYDFHNDK